MKHKIFVMLLSGVILASCTGGSIPQEIFHDSLSLGKLAAATAKASESDVIQGMILMEIGSEEGLLRAYNGIIEKANEFYENDITYGDAIQKAFAAILEEDDTEEGFAKLLSFAASETLGTVSSIYIEPIKTQYDDLPEIQDFTYTTPKETYRDAVKKVWSYTIIDYDITMLVTRSETSAGYFWEFEVEE
jgi:hypothetical protein